MKRYIAVSGTIGAGKTSLVEFLVRHFDIKPFFEPNDFNPYLDDFYRDMKRWAFHSQLYFLSHKFRIHRELERFRGAVVQDRTIYEDAEIFAEMLHRSRHICTRDWQTYSELYQTIRRALRPPDLMIFLRCSVRTTRKRIATRGRPSEQDIPVSYLRRLYKRYDEWIESYDLSPLVEINTERIDYVSDLVHMVDLLETIEQYIGV